MSGFIAGVDWYGTSPNAAGAANSKRFRGACSTAASRRTRRTRNGRSWFDDVYVTQTGFAATQQPSITGPTPAPDRPQKSGVYRAVAADGGEINQGYAFYLASDVLEGVWMGHEVDEYYVKPDVQRTAAIFLKPEDFPDDMRIFVLAAYNENGDRVEIGCLSEQVGANAVANASPGWYEFWMTYTPPAGYFRCRWEHEAPPAGRTSGRSPRRRRQPEHLDLRDAARVEARASTATFSVLLEARVPGQDGTTWRTAGWRRGRPSSSPRRSRTSSRTSLRRP